MQYKMLNGLRRKLAEVNPMVAQALDRAEYDLGSVIRPGYYSDKEPTHLRFGRNSHFGIGDYGEHIGAKLPNGNVHIYKDRLFIIPKDGQGFSIPLSGEYLERALVLLSAMRERSEPWLPHAND